MAFVGKWGGRRPHYPNEGHSFHMAAQCGLFRMAKIYLHLIPQALAYALDHIEVDEETGEITAGQDELDAVQTSAAEKVEATALYIKDLDDDIDDLKVAIESLTKRKQAIEKKSDRLRSLLFDAVQAIGPVKTKYVTVSLRNNKPSVEVEDSAVSALPDEYKTVKITPKRSELIKALQSGKSFYGVSLIQTQSVSIRV